MYGAYWASVSLSGSQLRGGLSPGAPGRVTAGEMLWPGQLPEQIAVAPGVGKPSSGRAVSIRMEAVVEHHL